MRRRTCTFTAAAALTLILSACAVGPDYVRPATPAAPAFKEDGPWRPAANAAAMATEAGAWWKGFGDARLDALVDEANAANQTLAAAQAQYAQAQALLQGAQAS